MSGISLLSFRFANYSEAFPFRKCLKDVVLLTNSFRRAWLIVRFATALLSFVFAAATSSIAVPSYDYIVFTKFH